MGVGRWAVYDGHEQRRDAEEATWNPLFYVISRNPPFREPQTLGRQLPTYADIHDHDHDLGRGDSNPMIEEGKPGPRPLEQTALWGMALERGDCRRDGLEWGILWMDGFCSPAVSCHLQASPLCAFRVLFCWLGL